MSDFSQPGVITTLHKLPGAEVRFDAPWEAVAAGRPVVVVLPAHQRELATPAFAHILRTLREIPVLSGIFLSINGASAAERMAARALYREAETVPPLYVLNGDRAPPFALPGLPTPLPTGKGWNLWLAFAAVRLSYPAAAVLCHDTDIRSYQPDFPARLAWPLVIPEERYHFVKGYYARVGRKLYGRVTRLFMMPFLRALIRVFGHSPLFDFLAGFRYLLAGECAMDPLVVDQLRMPLGWGVDLGLLTEVYRHLDPARICQIDLGDNYDHKHHPFSAKDAGGALSRMSVEIAVTLVGELAKEGQRLDAAAGGALIAAYRRQAEEALRKHRHDAAYNGLDYDAVEEALLVERFASNLAGTIEDAVAGRLPHRPSAPPLGEVLADGGPLREWLSEQMLMLEED